MFAGILQKEMEFLKFTVFLEVTVVADLQCILQGSFYLFPIYVWSKAVYCSYFIIAAFLKHPGDS